MGKVTEKTWRDLYAQMSTLAFQLGDISDVELGRLLVSALPTKPWRRKLAQDEDRKTERGTLVFDGLPEDATAAEVENMVLVETGSRPKSVRRMGKRVKITPQDDEHRGSIKMVYDRQKLQGGNVVKVSPDTSEMGAREINELMIRWLRMDQRIASAPGREPVYDRRHQPRWTREIDADSDDSTEGDRVQQVGKGGKRPDKRPPTPPKQPEKKEEKKETSRPSTPIPQPRPESGATEPCSNCGHSPSADGKGKGGGDQIPNPNPPAWQPSTSWAGRGSSGSWNNDWRPSGKGSQQWQQPQQPKGEKGKGKGDQKGKGGGDQGKGGEKGKGKNGGRGKGIGAVTAWEE
jgi:hypothetical protein